MFKRPNPIMLIVTVVLVTSFLIEGCSASKPSKEQVKKPVETYLKNQQKCSGNVTVDKLTITGVGDYDKDFGGWPVYAEFDVTCQEGGISTTWKGSGSDKAMAAVVRRGLSGYEAFMPRVFEDGLRRLDGITESLDQKLQNDWKKAFNQ